MDVHKYLHTKALNRGQGTLVDPVAAAAAQVTHPTIQNTASFRRTPMRRAGL